ncbi:hypothetical protein SLS55_009223 [Diplodia seriata]|uniref:Uncharacterized protein n=1 Tax=Diplodia seriata TaxID=420778 RepID=A0ABR3C3H9_9PEZI
MNTVADKLSHWGKGVSERSAGAKEKKMEERQRQERKALKMSISSPRPADSSSARPSFSSEGSVRSLLGAGKTGGSMADRMAKRDGSNFEIPFWPRGKKDRSTASSAKGSPQHTLPHGDERVTQFGDFIEPELVSAPWNQQVTKGSPFSSPYSSRSSVDKQGSDSRSSSPSAKFFGRFVPSPTSLFGTGSQIRPPRTQRRGSDDSFFGCQGISVEEENAAQHLVQQDGHDGHIESLDFRAPPTPPHGAREHFGRNPPGLGQSGGGGGGGGGGRGDDDDDDAHKRSPLATNEGVARVSPLLRDTQHRPMVSDQGVDRRSVAAELVSQRQRRNGGDHDAREPRGDDHRVSWWDPPSPQPPCRPVTSSKKGKEKASGDGGLQAGAQKPRKGSGEPETENHTYWKDYRKKLRGTNFSRGSGWEDGKPF